jgi:hypothetical protein
MRNLVSFIKFCQYIQPESAQEKKLKFCIISSRNFYMLGNYQNFTGNKNHFNYKTCADVAKQFLKIQ